jgi:CRISPR-associated protein Csx10
VRYLNAYPIAEYGSRIFHTLPVPRSWHAEKDIKEPSEEGDASVTVADLCHATAQAAFPDEQSKGLSAPFFYLNHDGELLAVNPKRRMAIHTQRDPRKGRAVKENGEVFRYESIAQGERFGGVILLADGAEHSLSGEIKDLLERAGELSIGGSRTGGYGRAQVVGQPIEKPAWREPHTKTPVAVAVGQTFTLTLLSHALLRDDNGQWQAALVWPKALRDKIEPCDGHCFQAAEIVGGFNRKWGLPLTQTVALQAGSVFKLKAIKDITADELKTLVNDGLGARRGEGFGRVAINLNENDSLTWVAPKKAPVAMPVLNGAAQATAQAMLTRIMQTRLDERLAALINERELKQAPPNSQIARLRSVVREALQTASVEPIEKFLEKAKNTAQRHYEKARVTKDNFSLIDWVKGLSGLEKDEKRKKRVDDWLPTLFDHPRTAPIALGKDSGKAQTAKEDFLFEYRLRLVDGVLARAAKERRD